MDEDIAVFNIFRNKFVALLKFFDNVLFGVIPRFHPLMGFDATVLNFLRNLHAVEASFIKN